MSNDPNRQSAMVEFHDLMLKEVRVGIAGVRGDVSAYRAENMETQRKLDAHISACDGRRRKWEQQQETTPRATPAISAAEPESALFSKKRILRKLFESVANHFGLIVIMTIIQMCLFAWNHGFRPNVEPPATPTAHTP